MNNFDEPVKKAETDAEILEMFGEDERIVATMEKDPCKPYEARGVWRDGARLFPGLL